MGTIPELTPEDHKRLNLLAQRARTLKEKSRKSLAQYRGDLECMREVMLECKREALEAREAHVQAYTALGFSRQQEWQRERISQGQCRLCGNQAEPGTKHCNQHNTSIDRNIKGAREARISGAIVEP